MSSPAGQLEAVYPGVDGTAVPRRVRQVLVRQSIRGRAVATLMAVAIVSTLGGSGVPLASANAQHLQTRAADLHARWKQMVADGVPSSDLAALQAEWKAATAIKVFGAGSQFWLPEGKSTVDRWEAQSVDIWASNLRLARAGALGAEQRLTTALGADSEVERKARHEALDAASTPADFITLRSDWDLQTRLIPIDRRIASEYSRVIGLTARAANLGIVSDPADAVLVDSRNYALQDQLGRLAHAERLIRSMTAVRVDLGARLDAATITKKAFTRATYQISLATMYGLGVSAYGARVDADRKAYAAATSAGQFGSITDDLNQTAAAIQQALNVLRSKTHIVSGVSFYYQHRALSCEETATSMALTHQGIYLSQDQILAEMGADLRPQYRDARGILRWGNPYLTFVGSVDGIENVTGLQANYPPLVRVARAHGAKVIAYGWMPAESIYARLTAGHPVVVYATYDWAWYPRHDYLSYDARWIPYIGPAQSHVYTAVGVKPDAVLVNDPIRGQYWVGKRSFEAAYSDFQEAIVFA
jgi:hypothetical protein